MFSQHPASRSFAFADHRRSYLLLALALAVILWAGSMVAANAASLNGKIATKGGSAYVRTGASTATAPKTSLANGRAVQISCFTTGESINGINRWYRLTSPYSGYVFSSLISVSGTVPNCVVAVAGNIANAATGSTCDVWLSSAGVSDHGSAVALINRESGCNPNAVNRASGACGVAQELPCGKSGCKLGDGACQIKWMNSYVLARYGSWSAALRHSNSYNWY